jgi:hypothetical protein
MYQLSYRFDAGSGICLWATNDEAREKFGYPVDLRVLPISHDTIARGRALIDRFDSFINWDDPAGRSPWSITEFESFEADSIEFFSLLRNALGLDFDVLDGTTRFS